MSGEVGSGRYEYVANTDEDMLILETYLLFI